MIIVPFGKYKDRPVEEMLADASYMHWLEAQPWFRDRFGHLISGRDAEAASRTPVHNKMQTMFLNREYRRAFMRAVGGNPGSITENADVEFEYQDGIHRCDVFFLEIAGNKYFYFHIEVKPTVGDDYPGCSVRCGGTTAATCLSANTLARAPAKPNL